MAAAITVTVRVVDGPSVAADARIVVAHALPVGAAWSHLPPRPGAVNPPVGVTYVLNGLRTVPSAWMADGDELVIHLPEAG